MPPGQATKIRAKYVGARRIGPRSQTIGQGAQRLQHVFEHRPGAPPFMEHMEAARVLDLKGHSAWQPTAVRSTATRAKREGSLLSDPCMGEDQKCLTVTRTPR